MVIQSRRSAKVDGLGFTLLELLLTVVLLLALMAALVFNFAPLRVGAELEEGGRQFEALIRFASAQAANSGRTVQLRFGGDPGLASSTNEMAENLEIDSTLRLVWEPDPILQPGVFVVVREAAPLLAEVMERLRIDQVQTETPVINQTTNETAEVLEPALTAMPPITFFPDGSSDTADIVLAGKNSEDSRRIKIHLSGVTGQLRSEMQSIDPLGGLEPIEWMEEDGTIPPEMETASVTRPATIGETGPDFSEPQNPVRETTTTNTNDFSDIDFP